MTITELRAYPADVGHCNRVFTEMVTDEGIVGISEVTTRRKGMTLPASIRELECFLVGNVGGLMEAKKVAALAEANYS